MYDIILIEATWGQDMSFRCSLLASDTVVGCTRPGGNDTYKNIMGAITEVNRDLQNYRLKLDFLVASLTSKSETDKRQLEEMRAGEETGGYTLIAKIPSTDYIKKSMHEGEPLVAKRATPSLVKARKSLEEGSTESTSLRNQAILEYEKVGKELVKKWQENMMKK